MEGRRLLLLYATQTGTAKEVAEHMAREAKRRHFVPRAVGMDTYATAKEGFLLPQEELAIFVVATTGQGDPPDNMKKFWRFLLRKGLPKDALSSLKFAVFGLGDSSYQKFNFMAKKLYNRLLALGAQPIHSRGDGDDQHEYGLYGALDPWLEELWVKLLERYPLPPGAQIEPAGNKPPPKYKLVFQQESTIAEKTIPRRTQHVQQPPYDYNNPYMAQMTVNKRLTTPDWEQDVRHIEFDLDDSGLMYSPGDVLCVLPQNLPEKAEDFLQKADMPGDLVITDIIPVSKDEEMPQWELPCTVKELVQKYLDINAPPRRYFFEVLSFFTSDEREKDRLLEFASSKGQDELIDYCIRPKRTAAEVFRDFPGVKVPLEYLLELLPIIRARSFSISSSSKVYPNTAHVTAAVVGYKTLMKDPRIGLCSSYLASLDPTKEEVRVGVWIQKGFLSLPKDPSTPIVMVGPGTGLAIFRAFIQERMFLAEQGVKVGKTVFFFGCRHREKDFLYGEEWNRYQEKGILTSFYCAFSRDQDNKIYVQHLMRQHSKEIWDILVNEKGHFYLSGSARRMPIDVREALVWAINKEGGEQYPTEEAAEAFLQQLERENRLATETWF